MLRRITRELDRLIEWRGTPEVIRVDNGPEFTFAVFEVWVQKHKIKLCFIGYTKILVTLLRLTLFIMTDFANFLRELLGIAD